jgi:hypothetical protein
VRSIRRHLERGAVAALFDLQFEDVDEFCEALVAREVWCTKFLRLRLYLHLL